jgi:DNA-binding response OmpR family regulator
LPAPAYRTPNPLSYPPTPQVAAANARTRPIATMPRRLCADCRRRQQRGGTKLNLQPTEFRLLEYLMRHTGRVVTRAMLLEGVWDYHFDPQTNVIDVHVSRLRQKVDRPFPTALIHTMRNAGYMLRAESP